MPERPVEKNPLTSIIGVCGGGAMGSGIAEVFVLAGHKVRLVDVNEVALENAVGMLRRDVDRLVAKGVHSQDDAEDSIARLFTSTKLTSLNDSQLVIEAVAEDIDVKRDVFSQLESLCSPDAVFASNTSTLSVTEIASVLRDPGRIAGAHFFNPAPRMKLVELTPGLDTRPQVLDQLRAWLEAAGKTPVIVQESPGGIVSRLQLLVRNEAVRMVVEGVATSEDIDTAMKLGSGWPMGPLELIDLVGVDLHVRNSETLAREMGSDRFQPPPFLRQLVRGGRLGRKSGAGIFQYPTKQDSHSKDRTSPS